MVVKRGSLRRASEDLNISQPALSNSLKNLEELLGVLLLERSPQGVFPTAFGDALNQCALSALASMDRGKLEIDLLKRGSKGHIRVGAPGGMIEQIVPEIIADINGQKRDYGFSVTFGYLNYLLDQLIDGKVDFLISTYWPQANLTANLAVDHLADLSLSIFARPSHPLADKKNVSFEDISKAQWILPDSPGMRNFVKNIFGEGHASVIHQPIFSDHIPFIHSMMEKMDLLCIIPDYVVANEVRDGRFVALDYPKIETEFSAGLIYLEGRSHTPAMVAFIEAAKRIGAEKLL